MRRIKDFFAALLGSGLGIVGLAAFLYFNFYGIYHSFNKHGTTDGLVSVFVPPYAWYRTAESWWHDDFADVDWQARLESDVRTSIRLTGAAADPDPQNANDLSRARESFGETIGSYPEDKFEHIARVTSLYIEYSGLLGDDLANSLVDMTSSPGNMKPSFSLSARTLQLEKELSRHTGTNEIVQMREYLIALLNEQTKNAASLNEVQKERIAQMTGGLIAAMQLNIERMNIAHREIFGRSR